MPVPENRDQARARTTSCCRPHSFPSGTEPFTDPLASFCVQVHVKYTTTLARTEDGGGSAFAGWESGRPFYGNICFPDVPDPLPPDEGTAIVSKSVSSSAATSSSP